MDGLRDILEAKELLDVEKVNERISNGWDLLAVAPGKYEDGQAYFLYCIGRTRREDRLPVLE